MSADTLRDWARGIAEGAHIDDLKAFLARLEHAAAPEERSDGEVWSAVPLEETERAALAQRLRARYGDELEIEYHVEPSILGGLIVRVGDRYLDGSLASKLGQLRQELVTGRVR